MVCCGRKFGGGGEILVCCFIDVIFKGEHEFVHLEMHRISFIYTTVSEFAN